jgi:hypothetical protein
MIDQLYLWHVWWGVGKLIPGIDAMVKPSRFETTVSSSNLSFLGVGELLWALLTKVR